MGKINNTSMMSPFTRIIMWTPLRPVCWSDKDPWPNSIGEVLRARRSVVSTVPSPRPSTSHRNCTSRRRSSACENDKSVIIKLHP